MPNDQFHDPALGPDGRPKFKKGNPGGGRPRGYRRMADDLRRALRRQASPDEIQAAVDAMELPPSTALRLEMAENKQEALAEAIVQQAFQGHSGAREFVFGRLDPVPKAFEISGPNGGPIRSASMLISSQATSARVAEAEYFGFIHEEGDGGEPTDDPDGEDSEAGDAEG